VEVGAKAHVVGVNAKMARGSFMVKRIQMALDKLGYYDFVAGLNSFFVGE
jgi:hypothetical protein